MLSFSIGSPWHRRGIDTMPHSVISNVLPEPKLAKSVVFCREPIPNTLKPKNETEKIKSAAEIYFHYHCNRFRFVFSVAKLHLLQPKCFFWLLFSTTEKSRIGSNFGFGRTFITSHFFIPHLVKSLPSCRLAQAS